MSLSLLEKYELYRQRYKPGTRWKDKGVWGVIKELEILPKDTPNVPRYYGTDEMSNDNFIPFRIISSTRNSGRYENNSLLSWSQKYMENYYELIMENS